MRSLVAAAQASLSSPTVTLAFLVEMLFPIPLRMTTASMTISYGGNDYLGLGNIGGIDVIDDSPGEFKNLAFSLNGVSSDLIAIALDDNIRGKSVNVRLAIFDADTAALLDAPLIWTGTLDQMPIQANGQTCTIAATAEHRGTTFARPKPLRYTDGDQQLLYPGDTSMRFVVSQSTHQDIWPAAAFFKQ